MQVTLVCHTHWDREWYEPFDRFRDRLVEMMDTLIPLLSNGYPHFHLDGQTAVIDDYLDDPAGPEADLARLAAEGRISRRPVGHPDGRVPDVRRVDIRQHRDGAWRATASWGRGRSSVTCPTSSATSARCRRSWPRPAVGPCRGVARRARRRSSGPRSGGRRPTGAGSSPSTWPWATRRFELPAGPGPRAARRDRDARRSGNLGVLRRRRRPGADHGRAATTTVPIRPCPQRLVEASPSMPGFEAKVGALTTHLPGPPTGEHPVWRGELRSAARAHLLPGVYSTRVHQKRERGRLEALLERVRRAAGRARPRRRVARRASFAGPGR